MGQHSFSNDDITHRLHEYRQNSEGKRLELAQQLEAGVQAWLTSFESNPPTTEDERRHLQSRSDEFRRMLTDQLENLASACSGIVELVSRFDEIPPPQRAVVLRDYVGAILEGEAATARALGSVQKVCDAVERAT